jgi:hypothetical protein
MAAMPFDPVPLNLVIGYGFIQPLPQGLVFHGFALGSQPTVALPAVNPLGNTLSDIL